MNAKKVETGSQKLMLWLGCAVLAIAVALPDAVQAQCQHGAAIFKSCQSPKRSCGDDADCDDSNECTADSCDTVTLDNHTDCTISLTHADTCGDTTKITEAWDVQDTAGDSVRVPAVGDLPIISVTGNAICCPGPVLPCFVGPALDGFTILNAETSCGNLTLPADPSPGSVSFRQNTYEIQPDDPDPLEDQANVKVKDLCNAGVPGCSTFPSTVQFTAGTDLETGCVNDPEQASTPCTDTDDNVCTQAGCDGAGACDQDHISAPASEPCPDTDGDDCSTAGCDGAGACDQLHGVAPNSTPCPDTDGNLCTTAGCNGAGACDQNHIETPCPGECLTGACDPGTGQCIPEPQSTPCGDTDNNICTQAGCDGAGACDQGHLATPESDPCPDTDNNECTVAGCDDAASCDQRHILQPVDTVCEIDGKCDQFGECIHPPPPDDHYKCYKTRQLGAKFAERPVTLEDQFGQTLTTVKKPQRFCNPVDKNGEGINDPTAHLMCYKIREPKFQRRDVVVENQFGQQTFTVTRPDTLCAPAEKDAVPSDLRINHFKCYKVRSAKGTPSFVPPSDVNLEDQFETKYTKVIRPKYLCNPVDKEGEGVVDPEGHLTCYRIKDAPGQPRFQRREAEIVDQFAEQDLKALTGDCRQGTFLCVPSTKRIPSPSGAFLDPTTDVLD